MRTFRFTALLALLTVSCPALAAPPSNLTTHAERTGFLETGRYAERLRRQGAGVHLSVGCEFVLYVPGIVPGANVQERVENLLNGTFDPVTMSLVWSGLSE